MARCHVGAWLSLPLEKQVPRRHLATPLKIDKNFLFLSSCSLSTGKHMVCHTNHPQGMPQTPHAADCGMNKSSGIIVPTAFAVSAEAPVQFAGAFSQSQELCSGSSRTFLYSS